MAQFPRCVIDQYNDPTPIPFSFSFSAGVTVTAAVLAKKHF